MSEPLPPFAPCADDPAYRAWAIDDDGRVLSVVEVEADDDASAIWLASALGRLYPVALWRGARCLGHFSGDAPGL